MQIKPPFQQIINDDDNADKGICADENRGGHHSCHLLFAMDGIVIQGKNNGAFFQYIFDGGK